MSPDQVVMVVDDHPLNQRFLRRALQAEGFTAICARDAAEARATMDSHRPWLVMVDLQMPGYEGLAFTRVLKADPATRDILIVAFTSYGWPDDEERIRSAGCDAYLTKPVDLVDFHAIIRALQTRPLALADRPSSPPEGP